MAVYPYAVELENGVTMSTKRRSFLSLIFTCLCFMKPLLMKILVRPWLNPLISLLF